MSFGRKRPNGSRSSWRGAAAVDELPEGIRSSQEAVAETIENNVRKVIIDEHPINPKYYEKMSDLLETLVEQRRADALAYEAYLAKIVELTKQVQNPASSTSYPAGLTSSAQRALYDNLDQNKDLALLLDDRIRYVKKDGWRGNVIKERVIKQAIYEVVKDVDEVERIFEIVLYQREY